MDALGRLASSLIAFHGVTHTAMADKKDRFEGVDDAIDRVREELDEAVEESKEAGSAAAKEVREAIDDLEERLSNLRKRDQE